MAKATVSTEQDFDKVNAKLDLVIARINSQSSIRAEASPEVLDHLKTVYSRRFDRARKTLIEGSVVTAEQEYRGLIEDLETLGDGADLVLLQRSHMNLAASLWEQDRHSEAVPWLEKASLFEPNEWRANRSRALAFIAKGDEDGALPYLRKVCELKPDDVDHLCSEAWTLKNCGRVDEALVLLRSRAFPDAAYFATLSLTYLRAEKYEDAEQAARKAFEIDSGCLVAQTALAYSLGTPIINRRHQRKTLLLVPDKHERIRLLEAIKFGEKAADTLRASHRLHSLAELVGALAAMCAAAGQLDKAIDHAREALGIRPDDEAYLTNLWCAQMRNSQYPAALETAVRLESISPTTDSWQKKSQALLAGDNAQVVIDEWEQRKRHPGFANSINSIVLVAQALSDRHRTEEALTMLNSLLAVSVNDCRLLLARATLLAELGNHTDAEKDLNAAELHASSSELGQVLVDSAIYYSQRNQWEKATTRLEQVGADSFHNPLFSKYLACLFNQGDYRRSVMLAEEAIAGSSEFVEDYHTIAAHAHQVCGNLPRARDLLDQLVGSRTHREDEHRKLLGWIYWRLDDLPQAYDVLLKGLRRKPKDVDLLVLLSAVCSVRGRHSEALEYACRGVNEAPNDVSTRLAMVRAVFSCAQGFSIKQEYLDAHFQSLSFLQQHESGLIQTVSVEDDLHSILEMVKARAGQVRKFEDFFGSNKLPMGFLAVGVGVSPFNLWSTLLRHPRLRLRIAQGNAEEQQNEQEVVRANNSISVDLLALFSLHHLGLLNLLPQMFQRIFAHGALLLRLA